MIKIYFLMLISFLVMGTVWSQDRIITTEGDTIQAKIITITEKEASYKRYGNQEGATFIIASEKIHKILWTNGDVDEYNQTAASPINAELPVIIDNWGRYFEIANGEILNSSQMEELLFKNNLSYLWEKYSSGSRQFRTGLGFVIGGGSALILGSILAGAMFSELDDVSGLLYLYPTASYLYPIAIMSVGIAIAGGVLTIIGIPKIVKGAIKRKEFVKDYNKIARNNGRVSQNAATWQLGATGNGIGFTLNF
jgi:hypothetical protein